MTTHRSLNKLEFKAHMSIHNKVAVPESETHESSNHTRDRFGKNHRISNEDGSSRLPVRRSGARTKKKLSALVLLPAAHLLLSQVPVEARPVRNTDVQVESSSLDERTIDEKLGVSKEEKPVIYSDGSTAIAFNDDGDPNMSMKF